MEAGSKKILIALDASLQAYNAVRYAGRLLRPGQADFTLLHVMNAVPEALWDLEGLEVDARSAYFASWEAHQKQVVEDFMDRAIHALTNAGHSMLNIHSIVRRREVGISRDIAIEAMKGYDAVLVGRRGVSEVEDLIFGSVASKLIHLLNDVPVAIVGGRPDPSKILVAMDCSEGAMKALQVAGTLVNGSRTQLILLHVMRGFGAIPPDYDRFYLPETAQSEWIEREKATLRTSAEKIGARFEEGIRMLEAQGLDTSGIRTKIVQAPSRSWGIVVQAQAENCGTIMLGRRGLSRVQEFILGRVSSKVLQLAKNTAVWVVN